MISFRFPGDFSLLRCLRCCWSRLLELFVFRAPFIFPVLLFFQAGVYLPFVQCLYGGVGAVVFALRFFKPFPLFFFVVTRSVLWLIIGRTAAAAAAVLTGIYGYLRYANNFLSGLFADYVPTRRSR